MTDLTRLSASQVLPLLRQGTVTVEEYATALLSRIRQRDPVVHAWAYLDPEFVLAQARKLDQIPPEKRGPLHGLPIAIKDVAHTNGTQEKISLPIFMLGVLCSSMPDSRHANALQLRYLPRVFPALCGRGDRHDPPGQWRPDIRQDAHDRVCIDDRGWTMCESAQSEAYPWRIVVRVGGQCGRLSGPDFAGHADWRQCGAAGFV